MMVMGLHCGPDRDQSLLDQIKLHIEICLGPRNVRCVITVQPQGTLIDLRKLGAVIVNLDELAEERRLRREDRKGLTEQLR